MVALSGFISREEQRSKRRQWGTLDTILPYGILSPVTKGPRKICLLLLSFVSVSFSEIRKSK
jgi:hypothetical protein